MSNYSKLITLGIELRGKTSGQTKVKCPRCSHTRKKNRAEPCLSVNIDNGVYNCHHCHWNGSVSHTKAYTLPENDVDTTAVGFDSDFIKSFFSNRGISEDTVKDHRVSYVKEFIPKDGKLVDCVVWNYMRDSVLINRKYRSESKGFKMTSGAELIFYGLDKIGHSKTVVITEGEIDAMSFHEAGFRHALSVPNGASSGNNDLSYLEKEYDMFMDLEKIIIATDNDEPGVSLMHELARRIGKERCYKVVYPGDCKDANEVLVKHGKKAVMDLVKNAEPFPIEGVVRAIDTEEGLMRLYRDGTERGIELNELGRDFCDKVRFRTSMLYVWTGIPSHGKSSFVNQIEILLSASHGWKWAIYSPEHYPLEYLVYRYVELLVGRPFFKRDGMLRITEPEIRSALRFIDEHFYFIRPEGDDFTLEEIMSTAKNLIFRYGVRGFTIDPWNTIQHDLNGETETKYIESALNKLTIFKQKYDIMINLIAHPNKMRKQDGVYEVPNLYDIAGSAHFFNKCDFGITVYRNFTSGLTEIYVQKCKFKNLGEAGYLYMSYVNENSRYKHHSEVASIDNIIPAEHKQSDIFEHIDDDDEPLPF